MSDDESTEQGLVGPPASAPLVKHGLGEPTLGPGIQLYGTGTNFGTYDPRAEIQSLRERLADALTEIQQKDSDLAESADLIAALMYDPEAAEVAAERVRQASLGYTPESDDRHGALHLAQWADGYLRRGMDQGNRSDLIKASAMLQASAAAFRRLRSMDGKA